MVGAIMHDRRPDLNVVTAGTLTMDGQPISWRTREALRRIGLSAPNHRSTQMKRDHGDEADLIIALAPEHVEWVRRNFSPVAHKTVTLKRLVRHLSTDRQTPLAERVAALVAHEVSLEPWKRSSIPVVARWRPSSTAPSRWWRCATNCARACDQSMTRTAPASIIPRI